jgi:hypothetical protein
MKVAGDTTVGYGEQVSAGGVGSDATANAALIPSALPAVTRQRSLDAAWILRGRLPCSARFRLKGRPPLRQHGPRQNAREITL